MKHDTPSFFCCRKIYDTNLSRNRLSLRFAFWVEQFTNNQDHSNLNHLFIEYILAILYKLLRLLAMTHKREIYPKGTVVKLKETDAIAIITHVDYLLNNQENFLNYRIKIAGRKGHYAAYPDDLELLVLPKKDI